jgi:hypothetical protein
VVSTRCLFLLLGGGAAFPATRLGKNSVGTKQIKNGAVTGIKIKKGTITGTNVNLAKLGTVPSATKATNAGHASTADTASSATTARTPNALAPMEPTRTVRASGATVLLGSGQQLHAE